jgi:hypothetical protein
MDFQLKCYIRLQYLKFFIKHIKRSSLKSIKTEKNLVQRTLAISKTKYFKK